MMLPIRSLAVSSLRCIPRVLSVSARSQSTYTAQSLSLLAPQKAGEPKGNKAEVATLTLPDGKQIKLPYLKGTQGPDAVDIRKLYDQSGVFTYDPGFTSTASCHSDITYIDGNAGVLQYRGYDIAELAEKCDFDEVSYLIMYGELPTAEQKKLHRAALTNHRMVPEQLIGFFKGFKSNAHPMAMMTGVVGALSAFYHDSLDISSAANRQLSAYRLIAKMPTIAAIAYKTSIGQPIVYPRDDLSYAENFLYMMQAIPTRKFHLNPIVVKALETFLILHLDHEQNASTSTVRIAGSSLANPFACLASGISSLWGPSHGGANEAVIKMLEQIGSKDRIPEFIKRAKDKNDSFRLMGFGHRVYKNFDPRSKIIKKVVTDVLHDLKATKEPLLEIAVELEKIALTDPYFIEKKLYPNVDFYSGILMRAMGIPTSMFTVMFALGRTTGWISQWKEMIEYPQHKIARPRQVYTGHTARPFVALKDRKEVLPVTDEPMPDTKHSFGIH